MALSFGDAASRPGCSSPSAMEPAAQSPPEASPPIATEPVYCSFCGKSQHDVTVIVAGPGHVYICDYCVVASFEIAMNHARRIAHQAAGKGG